MTTAMQNRPTFVAALKGYFGFKKGETASDFMRELKELTQQDKNELYDMMVVGGIDCEPPTGYKK